MDFSGKLFKIDDSSEEEGFSFFGALQSFGNTIINAASNVVNKVTNYITGSKRSFDDFINEPASSSDSSLDESFSEEAIIIEGEDVLDTTPVLESPLKKQKVRQDIQIEEVQEEIQQPTISICTGPVFVNNLVNDFEGLEFIVVENNNQDQPIFDDINDIGMVEEQQQEQQEPQNNEMNEEMAYDFGIKARDYTPRAAASREARKAHFAKGYNVNGMRSNLYKRT